MSASSTSPATARLASLAAHLSPSSSSPTTSTIATMSTPPKKRCPITSHILDTTLGKPAQGVALHLEKKQPVQGHTSSSQWVALGHGQTNADGRVETLLPTNHVLQSGVYRITFDVAAYFRASNTKAFYPEVTIVFEVERPEEHYHVPLLINPYAYSTYRGS